VRADAASNKLPQQPLGSAGDLAWRWFVAVGSPRQQYRL